MKCFVRIVVTSLVLSSHEIGEVIGLRGDRAWSKGDLKPKTKMLQKLNGWMIESGVDESEPLESHLDALVRRLRGHTARIGDLQSDAEVLVSCILYTEKIPALYFENPLLELISSMGSDFDIDLQLLDCD